MMALKILRGITLILGTCIMFSLLSLIAISVYRVNQTRTESFRPQSVIEFFGGPKFEPNSDGQIMNAQQELVVPLFTELSEQEQELTELAEQEQEQELINKFLIKYPKQKLTGQLPIGRWACFHVKNFEENRKTNKSTPITRCAVNWRMFDSTIIELEEGSVGHTLLLDKEKLNSSSFKLEHSSNFYLRGEELRWMFYANADNFSLIIQTKAEYHTYLDIISNNLLHKFSREDEYLVRISSPEYILLMNYKDCIKTNNTRNLYELQDCGIPWN